MIVMRPRLVFAGPSLHGVDFAPPVDVIRLPPAVQGSVLEAVRRHEPSAILLIDGGFQSEPAVRHKEILWAIGQGIPVLGTASMGALRAAELHPFMHGCGLIFRWYRRMILAPDDAVAVQHGPEELGFTPVTEALIDLRRTFKAAQRAGSLNAEEAADLDRVARHMNFRDRTLEHVLDVARPARPVTWVREMLERLEGARIRQKQLDAMLGMKALLSGWFPPAPPVPDLSIPRVFAEDMMRAGLNLPEV